MAWRSARVADAPIVAATVATGLNMIARPLRRVWLAAGCLCLLLGTLSMTLSCLWAAQVLPLRTAWIPALFCLGVATYLWSRPTRKRPQAAQPL